MAPDISQVKTVFRNTLRSIASISSCEFAEEGSSAALPSSGKILLAEKYDSLKFTRENETDHLLSGKLSFILSASPEDFALSQTVLSNMENAFMLSSGVFHSTNCECTVQSIAIENVTFKENFFRAVCSIVFQARRI